MDHNSSANHKKNSPVSETPSRTNDSKNTSSKSGGTPSSRKIICRYGRGCTHMYDTTHRERFWHPDQLSVPDDVVLTNHMCNECGLAFRDLPQLQLHLKRKTAWSNASLVGCRISCLVDYKEWHEGYVTQFHKSGKHFVEFKYVNERRWLNMKKVAFYIVERPVQAITNSSEFKSDDELTDAGDNSLAPVDDWVYVEDITPEYSFAQSTLYKVFGSVQETGHKTKGHVVLTELDKERARSGQGSLLYGELLPRGANKAFSRSRLNAEDACCLYDLGMGTGKIIIQAFLQFRNLQYVFGIELSIGRYRIAEEAILYMIKILGEEKFFVVNIPGKRLIVEELPSGDDKTPLKLSDISGYESISEIAAAVCPVEGTRYNPNESRILHIECGDMFNVTNIEIADIVMMETDIPTEMHGNLCKLLSRMHEGARTLCYLDLKKVWTPSVGVMCFKQLESNRFLSDRFPTSWSVQRGHHFFLWIRIAEGHISTISHESSHSVREHDYVESHGSPTLQEGASPSQGRKKATLTSIDDDGDGPTAQRTRNGSLPRGGGGCLPFTFDVLSFGLFSRFRRHSQDRFG